MNGILKKIFSYLIVKILTFDILINLKYYIFRDYFRDIGKFSTSKKVKLGFKNSGGRIMAWFILRRNKNLLSNIYTNTKHGNQRMTYLCLKTLLEDVAVANDFFLNYDFNTGNKIKKPDIKKSLDQLNEEFPQLLLDHQFKTYNQLYGHLNRFSHFNFNDLQHQLVPLIQNKPKIIDKTDYINHFLVCFDVFSILQQIYFPFKEIFTEEKETKLKYIHRTDNNDWEYGVPNKMLRKMLRWTRWFDYAKGI